MDLWLFEDSSWNCRYITCGFGFSGAGSTAFDGHELESLNECNKLDTFSLGILSEIFWNLNHVLFNALHLNRVLLAGDGWQGPVSIGIFLGLHALLRQWPGWEAWETWETGASPSPSALKSPGVCTSSITFMNKCVFFFFIIDSICIYIYIGMDVMWCNAMQCNVM